ncbi:agmatinase family protein [Chloroflexi bacterium TSY]|nr:agmatinase family protein [Chloroflexi bacterium TSY]
MAGPEGDIWKVEFDRSNEPKREPGPIELNRYGATSGAYAGIPTFMGLPVCLTPDDLDAPGRKVDVAIIGAPLDMSMGQRGTAYGPRALRTAERYVPHGPTMQEGVLTHTYVMIKPFSVLKCVDYGDAGIGPFDIEKSHDEIRKRVSEITMKKVVPIVLGGDHSLMRPDVMAITDSYGKGNVGVIHFDAHHDAGNNQFGHTITHGTPVRRLIEDGHVHGKNFIQIGLRGYAPGEADVRWMREHGVRSHYMAEVERDGFTAVMNRAIAEALDGPQYVFISFDIDALDPAFAPGTGTPEPGGLTIREALPIARRLCAETPVVGMELVEVSPGWDPGYTTALNGLRIIQEAITGLAMRKEGGKFVQPHYLDPRTSGEDPVPGQRND